MSDTKQVAARFTEAFNAHDEKAIRALYAEDAVFSAPGDVRLEGPDEIAGYAMGWLNAFPDARIDVQNEVVDGDWVVQQFTFRGTHAEALTGPTGEIPATNRRLQGRGMEAVRVRGGKIVEDHLYFDQVEILTQLGLMPELAGAAR